MAITGQIVDNMIREHSKIPIAIANYRTVSTWISFQYGGNRVFEQQVKGAVPDKQRQANDMAITGQSVDKRTLKDPDRNCQLQNSIHLDFISIISLLIIVKFYKFKKWLTAQDFLYQQHYVSMKHHLNHAIKEKLFVQT